MRFRQFAAISTVVLFCGRASVEQTGLPVYGRLSGEKRKPWLLLVRKRCPCAGRHLLFFAAAKKSRRVLKFEVQHPASYKVLLWKNDTNNSSLKSG
jgi:hypothetical protein